MAFMVSPVRPKVALDGDEVVGLSADGMIVYLLLLWVLVSLIANFTQSDLPEAHDGRIAGP
jgi:hypothetical protein